MTALLLPFTHPNAFETIMYSLERDDGFVCSLACNRSSFWDHCDNAVIGRRSWSWNNWSVNGLQQSTVASSVRFFMYDQLYRRSTRSTEAPLSPLHSPVTCSYNIPILFESSGTNKRLESSIYSTLVVQTIDLTRERERENLYSNWMSLQPSRNTHVCIVKVLRFWKFLEQKTGLKIWTWSVLDLPVRETID